MSEKKDIRKLSIVEIEDILIASGEKKFRAKQIYQWLWQKGAKSFDEMSNLSKDLRNHLNEHFIFRSLSINTIQKSNDGTIKVAFELFDGSVIEGVIIPTDDRLTACISSQVGCSLDCKFCATGYMKRMRNIESSEIYDQVTYLNEICKKDFNKGLTNIVYMGMGEPLLNYNNVMASIEYITSPKGLGMSPKRITVSTSGVAKMIRKLADDSVRFNLAFSCHAPSAEKRSSIMSINNTNPLEEVVDALAYFSDRLKRRITFEYTLLHEFNDTYEDAENLARLCSKLDSKVNIISYNPIEEADFKPSSTTRLNNFVKRLTEKKVQVSVRQSRGKDIDAACGQLANKGK